MHIDYSTEFQTLFLYLITKCYLIPVCNKEAIFVQRSVKHSGNYFTHCIWKLQHCISFTRGAGICVTEKEP